MDNVSHVMLEHSSNCDTVRASCVTNLRRQAIILNSTVAVDIFLFILDSKREALFISACSNN